jgi:tetratricopeptide (TPR) repeat protein
MLLYPDVRVLAKFIITPFPNCGYLRANFQGRSVRFEVRGGHVHRPRTGASGPTSYAPGWHISGFLRLWAGQTDLAIEHGEMALRLSPRARPGDEALLIGTALFFGRRFEEAVPKLWVAIEAAPAFPNPYRYLAACYAHMGLFDEARRTIERLRAIMPEVRVDLLLPYRDPQHRELFLSGLRLALGDTA